MPVMQFSMIPDSCGCIYCVGVVLVWYIALFIKKMINKHSSCSHSSASLPVNISHGGQGYTSGRLPHDLKLSFIYTYQADKLNGADYQLLSLFHPYHHIMVKFDDSVFTTASTTATPLQIERAKVAALTKQLSRSLDEKKQLQAILKRTQENLETSQNKTLQLQRAQIKSVKVASQKQQVSVGHRDEVNNLKAELASTQKDLADEIEASKKRELRVQRLHEQLVASKHSKQEGGVDNHEHDMKIKTLVKQRDELLLVVKKQMKLIEVLRQQRLHVESAAEVLCDVKC